MPKQRRSKEKHSERVKTAVLEQTLINKPQTDYLQNQSQEAKQSAGTNVFLKAPKQFNRNLNNPSASKKVKCGCFFSALTLRSLPNINNDTKAGFPRQLRVTMTLLDNEESDR